MRRFAGGAALVLLLSVATTRLAVADFLSPLSPLLAPVMGPVCEAAPCGKGNCTETSGLPGYMCDCDPGWTQMHVGDHLRFLPCVIPNCTINRSCSNDTSALAPAPSPRNFSLSPDACDFAYCGSGGTCKNGTGLSYHCECKEGFNNVLNMTTMPCYQDCSYGADCAALGILPSSNSTAAPPAGSASNAPASAFAVSVSWQILLPLMILALVAMMGQAT
ncbi:fibropellin-1-like isoform X1 [Lolium rigidum]|uniref:fibropellin-1-like isoform X1 n=1 Tax=Lolium rigidum TaxID=89674 RepID=UPI001F5E0584|nr:fibropellin-1-like isoform X1 [Lolium rigidum]